jgi:hypothetical protein
LKPQPLAVKLKRLRQDAICARRYNDRVIAALKQIQKDLARQAEPETHKP